MKELVVLTFPDQARIDEVNRNAAKAAFRSRRQTFYASAVVAKSADGKLSVREITDEGHRGTKTGAVLGALARIAGRPGDSHHHGCRRSRHRQC